LVRLDVDEKEVRGYTHDFSPQGILVYSSLALNAGTQLKLQFSFGGDVCYLNISGHVGFCRLVEKQGSILQAAWINFSGLQDFEKKILISAIKDLNQYPELQDQSHLNVIVSRGTLTQGVNNISLPSFDAGLRLSNIRSKTTAARRVVVTGIGVIAPNGIGKEEFWSAVHNGISGISSISLFDTTEYPSKIAGHVSKFDPLLYMDQRKVKRTSRYSQFAIAAALMALEDSGVSISNYDRTRIGVLMGTAIGGMDRAEWEHKRFIKKGLKAVSPFLAQAMHPNAAAGEVASVLGVKGVNSTITTGCSSGVSSIGYAYNLITACLADIVIAGGSDCPVQPLTFGSFCKTGELSTRNSDPEKASRPFDQNRDGFVLSEGSAIVVLESLESAMERQAGVYGEILGFGISADGNNPGPNSPIDIETPANTLKSVLKTAEISASGLDYICAHGSACPQYDVRETKILKKVFGEHAYKIPISSIKSMIGHPLGASGSIQVVTSLLAIQNSTIPPTINFETPDPDCDLDYVPNRSRRKDLNVVLVNGLGYGGTNAFMLLGKFKEGK
jgi:3-oxoacyl-[acyl-carrier-protein] synthase II